MPSALFGWPDQGLSLDIAVHLGTLLAVIVYLRRDLIALIRGFLLRITGRGDSPESRLAVQLIIATLPAGIAGLLLHSHPLVSSRSIVVVGVTSIVFAFVLWIADIRAAQRSTALSTKELTLGAALFIGFAQALAIIPGTSRSGVTLTAARLLGMDRTSAARFSFLLSIPIIMAAGLLLLIEARDQTLDWFLLGYGAAVSALFALLTIHYFLRLLPKVGVVPFVIYRILFGLFLLLWLG